MSKNNAGKKRPSAVFLEPLSRFPKALLTVGHSSDHVPTIFCPKYKSHLASLYDTMQLLTQVTSVINVSRRLFPCMPLCYVLQVRDKAVKETWNKSPSQHKSTVTQVKDAYLAATQCSCCLPPSWDISPVSSFLSCHCFCVSFRILCPDLP